ncbi:MgtC/SapB family protein [Azospirillum doebereinerae]|uniref:Protein MgtC n=1 Tax=Azospirillum doebereinerae TaxID=92933 RepID=A0A3S0X2H3_9PROT|nr:MgtC/SapB family protein [Azospirillum doebereinerae]MCG5240998.1 MgtC/SapB family protein [Azospirillum doebereinerae]RUQ75987.1 MgtC/SapB family protein [Azospirillum doebereinerae]
MGLSEVLTAEEIGLRLLAAAFCGALLGLDREMRGKAAGLRTHTLIAISSALTTLVALEFWMAHPQDEGRSDPVRVIQGVAQAVGFISAGVMFRSGDTVRGATTAAVIWVAGALGIACGAGYYLLAGMALGMCLVVTVVFTLLMRWFPDIEEAKAAKRAAPLRVRRVARRPRG